MFRIKTLMLYAVLAGVALSGTSCDSVTSIFGGGKKKTTAPKSATAPPEPTGAVPKLKGPGDKSKDQKTGKEGKTSDLDTASTETGFSKEIGRDNPFDPVAMETSGGDIKQLMDQKPDNFRVLGTARTERGPIALLQIDTETPIVHEGDIMESGAVVKKISLFSVTIENNGKEVTLVMRTRKREVPTAQQDATKLQQQIPKIGTNLEDLYSEYLKSRYGESGASAGSEVPPESESGGTTSKSDNFSQFLNKSQEGGGGGDSEAPKEGTTSK